ncbi:MAG: hypothetical protein Q9227_004221 [Pyrenula ochraceoflavens]
MAPAADPFHWAYHGLRSRRTTSATEEPHHEPHSSQVAARQITPSQRPGIPETPLIPDRTTSPTGLRIRLKFSQRPSELRRNARRVTFADQPEVQQISLDDDEELSETDSRYEMGDDNKPKLKLSFTKPSEQHTISSPTPSTATPGTGLKLTFKRGDAQTASKTPASKPQKPAADAAAPSSSGRKRKKTLKILGNEDASEDELSAPAPPVKKVRLVSKNLTPNTPTVPTLKIKHKGKLPKRPLGVGYDSELDDAEKDPVVLSGMICRIQPEAEAAMVRKAVEEGKVGVNRAEGGLDMRFTPFDTNGRRGIAEIRGSKFAFIVVDLPCIIEGMKSWDKKAWVKSIDVSQMLLVLGPVRDQAEAENYPLPPGVDPKDFKYAHGITAPMKNVRKRRFNRTHRTSISAIEGVERRVNQLLADDDAAMEVQYETLDYDQYQREASLLRSRTSEAEGAADSGYDEEEDAEGEEDSFYADQNGTAPIADGEEPESDEDDIEAAFAAAIEAQATDESTQPATDTQPATNGTVSALDSSAAVTSASASPGATPAATQTAAVTEDEEASESGDDDDDSAPGSAADEEESAERQEKRERLQETEDSLAKQLDIYKKMDNKIIKGKLEPKIQALRELRRALREDLGIEDEA